jgi:peroxiredoxin (alkyl hydroperoxide reductase subunit C)
MMLASREEKFNNADCKLVGSSVDGLYSHIAWLHTIKEKTEYKGIE